MDFVKGLPNVQGGYDSIMVVVKDSTFDPSKNMLQGYPSKIFTRFMDFL